MMRFSLFIGLILTNLVSVSQAQWFGTDAPPANFEVDILLRNVKTTNSSLSSNELSFINQMYTELYALARTDVTVHTFEVLDHGLFSTLRPGNHGHHLRTKRVINLRLHYATSLICAFLPDFPDSNCFLPEDPDHLILFRDKFCRALRSGPFSSLQHVHGCSITYKYVNATRASEQKLKPKNATTALHTEHFKMVLMNVQHADATIEEAKFLEDAWLAVYKDLNQESRIHRVKLEAQDDHHLSASSITGNNDLLHRRTKTTMFHYWYTYFTVDGFCDFCYGGRRLVQDDDDGVVDDDDNNRRSLKLLPNKQADSFLFDEALLADFESELCDVLRAGPHEVFHGLGDCIVYSEHPHHV